LLSQYRINISKFDHVLDIIEEQTAEYLIEESWIELACTATVR
jgi:hypothetical protein